jgi:hypothetical protein
LSSGIYDLRVIDDRDTIAAAVEIPSAPRLSASIEPSGKIRFTWPKAAGFFVVWAPTDVRSMTPTRDTSYVLQEDIVSYVLPIDRTFRLAAVDSNYFRYLTDSSAVSVNAGRALGLFGAFAETDVSVDSVRAALVPKARAAAKKLPPR